MQKQRSTITEISPKDRVCPESHRYSGNRRIFEECEELVRNAIALHPDLPAANLVAVITDLAEPEFLAELDQILRSVSLIRMVRKLRATDHHKEASQSWLFPEIRDIAMQLPEVLPIGNGETVERSRACYEDLQNYRKVLNAEDRKKHREHVAAVDALMALWPQRGTPKTKGITLAQVDRKRAEQAGLI